MVKEGYNVLHVRIIFYMNRTTVHQPNASDSVNAEKAILFSNTKNKATWLKPENKMIQKTNESRRVCCQISWTLFCTHIFFLTAKVAESQNIDPTNAELNPSNNRVKRACIHEINTHT